MAAATLSAEERQTILSSVGVPLAASWALPLMGGGKKIDPISPPASFGDSIQVRYGTIPTYTPCVQERWELVAYVNSTVIDDVAQPVYRESSVSGALNDAYGLGRLSTVGGTEALPVADTYLEDGLGSVSAVMAGDGCISASYAYSPWGEAAVDVGEFGGPALSGLGYQPELSHYGYNGEESTGASGLQYLRARWYDPTRRKYILESDKPHLDVAESREAGGVGPGCFRRRSEPAVEDCPKRLGRPSRIRTWHSVAD